MTHPYRYGNTRRSSGGWVGLIVTFAVALLLWGISMILGYTVVDEGKGTRALENLGFTNVHVVDKSVFLIQLRGCDKTDSVQFTVEGTDTGGTVRQLEVCAGLFKGGTIRS